MPLEIERKFNLKLDDQFVEENDLFDVSKLIKHLNANAT